MSMNFGKLDFAVSFNPVTAFPLDARSYFEDKSLADNAANSAAAAGADTTKYYFGQLVTIYNPSTSKVDLYVINKKSSGTGGELITLSSTITGYLPLTGGTINGWVTIGDRLTDTIGEYSFANGQHLKAIGNYSHAEGLNTVARGFASHTEGLATETASGAGYAHAEGNHCQANGGYSYANGTYATASHILSFVWQGGTTGQTPKTVYYSHGAGTFNINPEPVSPSTDVASGFYIGNKNLLEYLVPSYITYSNEIKLSDILPSGLSSSNKLLSQADLKYIPYDTVVSGVYNVSASGIRIIPNSSTYSGFEVQNYTNANYYTKYLDNSIEISNHLDSNQNPVTTIINYPTDISGDHTLAVRSDFEEKYLPGEDSPEYFCANGFKDYEFPLDENESVYFFTSNSTGDYNGIGLINYYSGSEKILITGDLIRLDNSRLLLNYPNLSGTQTLATIKDIDDHSLLSTKFPNNYLLLGSSSRSYLIDSNLSMNHSIIRIALNFNGRRLIAVSGSNSGIFEINSITGLTTKISDHLMTEDTIIVNNKLVDCQGFLYYSSDGINWSTGTSCSEIAYLNGRLFIISSGKLYYTTNLVDFTGWTEVTYPAGSRSGTKMVTLGSNLFIYNYKGGNYPFIIYKSTDYGNNWETIYTDSSETRTDTISGDDVLILWRPNSTIKVSPDGSNWTEVSEVQVQNNFYYVGNHRYLYSTIENNISKINIWNRSSNSITTLYTGSSDDNLRVAAFGSGSSYQYFIYNYSDYFDDSIVEVKTKELDKFTISNYADNLSLSIDLYNQSLDYNYYKLSLPQLTKDETIATLSDIPNISMTPTDLSNESVTRVKNFSSDLTTMDYDDIVKYAQDLLVTVQLLVNKLS